MGSIGDQSSIPKDKSLRLLVTRFLELYYRDDVDLIGIDQAAKSLGVEKRRIYDIVKVFDSIGLLEKIGKGLCVWKGVGALYRVLSELKDQGMKEKFANVPNAPREIDEGRKGKFVLDLNKPEMDEGMKERFIPDLNKDFDEGMKEYFIPDIDIDEEDTDESSNLTDPDEQEKSISLKRGYKKEKARWNLARNVVKVFLCSDDDDIITFEDLTKALLIDESEDPPTNMKSKVRPLYDVVNVFSSLNLIEKINTPKTKTAAFRWIGPKPIADSSSSKKRASGVEVLSLNTKRSKPNCSYLEADSTNLTFEPSTSVGGSSNENDEVLDVDPISVFYPPEFYNPGVRRCI